MTDLRDPVVFAERQLLQTLLQYPGSFEPSDIDTIEPDAFTAPAHRAVFDGVRGAGGPQAGLSAKAWADRVTEASPLSVHGLVAELAVAPLPTRMDKSTGLPERRYISALLTRVQEVSLTRQIADAITEHLDPHGVAVLIDAEHQCMTTRGVHHRHVSTLTSTFTGAFKTDPALQARFLGFCARK